MKKRVTSSQFDILKNNFGDVSSWTIWKEPISRPRENIGDITIFNDKSIVERLNSSYIFVGLNAASHDVNDDCRVWGAFHSPDMKRSQDYKLRDALKGTDFEGCYITDILKGMIGTNASEIKRYAKNHPDEVNASIERFKNELKILDNPYIIAIGNDSYEILKENNFEVAVKIKHYSCYVNPDKYRECVRNQLLTVL